MEPYSKYYLQEMEQKYINDTPLLKFTKISAFGRAPTRGSSQAAGYDLYGAQELIIAFGKHATCLTDIKYKYQKGVMVGLHPGQGWHLYSESM